jgi:hypothetical protein
LDAPAIGALGSPALQKLAQHDVRADHLRAEPERQEANLQGKWRRSALTADLFARNEVCLLPREERDCRLTNPRLDVGGRQNEVDLAAVAAENKEHQAS